MDDYGFTAHALDMIKERSIKENWIKITMEEPDQKEDQADGTVHYIREIKEHGDRYLRVVVNPKVVPKRIVTLFFDRRLRRLS